MRPGLMRGQIAVVLGHAQQPLADAGIFLALGLISQLLGAFEKRFRIDHDRLQIRFRLERFRAKWIPLRVKKTRQDKSLEPRSDSIGAEKALADNCHIQTQFLPRFDDGAFRAGTSQAPP
ncbi:hypothetical protein SAMN05444164_7671 [Bradyrhizobium erythrophlei]|uniref:Uncharacterized protein n=1 Tax=Bradyrhizobium erythrophlei TaxID=1437360 RepID=A0A1H5HX32_9BRAD|nr:hypothetical protein SAMN05444164_7671 [Bradyrhizobium erythrophlei]